MSSRSLPCRSLPCRALTLIHEYSKPLTRPDWRNSKPIVTHYELYLHVKYTPNDYKKIKRIILNNIHQTEWHRMYFYIKYIGLDGFLEEYLFLYRVPFDIKKLYTIPGLNEAFIHNKNQKNLDWVY
jgi:hypothetical protein